MEKGKKAVLVILTAMAVFACNNGMHSERESGERSARSNRRQRTVIDTQEYFDFTIEKYNAKSIKIQDVLYTLNNGTFKNGNSVIKVKTQEGIIEISSDSGYFNEKNDCQIFGKFPIEVKAASSDCLYLRKDPKGEGYVMIDGIMYQNEAVPDLAVCIPLYGYSRNRIEVSNIMDGFIVMPSGTYWKN